LNLTSRKLNTFGFRVTTCARAFNAFGFRVTTCARAFNAFGFRVAACARAFNAFGFRVATGSFVIGLLFHDCGFLPVFNSRSKASQPALNERLRPLSKRRKALSLQYEESELTLQPFLTKCERPRRPTS
jgi:hypothetical protein